MTSGRPLGFKWSENQRNRWLRSRRVIFINKKIRAIDRDHLYIENSSIPIFNDSQRIQEGEQSGICSPELSSLWEVNENDRS